MSAPLPRAPHPEARDLVARINDRNARLIEQADAAVHQVITAIVVFVLGVLGALALIHFMTPCEAGHLCATVVGLVTRRVRADGTPPPAMESPLPHVVQHVREARASGMAAGEVLGYVSGWRWGWVCGFALGVLVGGFLSGVITGLVERHL